MIKDCNIGVHLFSGILGLHSKLRQFNLTYCFADEISSPTMGNPESRNDLGQ